jgi:hypothetical protein
MHKPLGERKRKIKKSARFFPENDDRIFDTLGGRGQSSFIFGSPWWKNPPEGSSISR